MEIIKQGYEFLLLNWDSISAFLGSVIVLLNAFTESHDEKQNPIVRGLYWIMSTMSFLKSKNVKGVAKFPLIPENVKVKK